MRVLLEDAAGNRTSIFGPVTRTITSSEAIGPGSDPALRGAANGDGASDFARLTRALGPAGESDAVGEPVRARACGARAAADGGRGADRQRGDRHGLQDDGGQRARAGQARGAADGRRRGLARRAAAGRLVARRDLPLPQPRQRHDRGGDRERAAAGPGRPAPGDPSAPREDRGRRSTSTAGCSAARCRAAASRSCCWRAPVAARGCASTSCAPTAAGASAPSTASARPARPLYRFRALSLSEAAYPTSRVARTW